MAEFDPKAEVDRLKGEVKKQYDPEGTDPEGLERHYQALKDALNIFPYYTPEQVSAMLEVYDD